MKEETKLDIALVALLICSGLAFGFASAVVLGLVG
jgi:hypothetical protein